MSEAKNRERGLKSAIHNPRVSEEAKQHDRELLASEFGEHIDEPKAEQARRRSSTTNKKSASTGPPAHSAEKATHRGSSTHTATATGTNRTARRASETGELQQIGEGKDKANVIRGLRSALKNPHVSEKAKEADRKKLRELGETVD